MGAYRGERDEKGQEVEEGAPGRAEDGGSQVCSERGADEVALLHQPVGKVRDGFFLALDAIADALDQLSR